jgi:hypothetical protein
MPTACLSRFCSVGNIKQQFIETTRAPPRRRSLTESSSRHKTSVASLLNGTGAFSSVNAQRSFYPNSVSILRFDKRDFRLPNNELTEDDLSNVRGLCSQLYDFP